jgi:hypothetical protein
MIWTTRCQDYSVGKEWSFQEMMLEKLNIHMQLNYLPPFHTLYTETNAKQIKDLHVRAKIIKLLEESTGEGYLSYLASSGTGI